jgi:hypothetical protein
MLAPDLEAWGRYKTSDESQSIQRAILALVASESESHRSMMAWSLGSRGAGLLGSDPGRVGLCVGSPETC